MSEKPKANMLTQFNAGEFSNALAGRVDYTRLKASLRKAVNVIPEVAGGLKKFYGTEYIERIINTSNFALIPFHHEDAAITLVLHDGYIDAIIDGHFEPLQLPAPLVSDYTKIAFDQANDVIFCCHKEIPPFTISYYGGTDFKVETTKFKDVPYYPFGYAGEYDGQLKVTGRTGLVKVEIPESLRADNMQFTYPISNSTTGYTNLTGKIFAGHHVRGVSNNSIYRPTLGNITVNIYKETAQGERSIIKSGIINDTNDINGTKEFATNFKAGTSTIDYIFYGANRISFTNFRNLMMSFYPDSMVIGTTIIVPLSSIEGYDSTCKYGVEITVGASHHNASDDFCLRNYYDETMRQLREHGMVLSSEEASYTEEGKIYPGTELYTATQNLVGRKIKFYQNSQDEAVKVWYQGLTVNITDNKTIVLSDGHYYMAVGGETSCGNIKPTHTEGKVSDGKVVWQYLHSGYSCGTIVSVENSHEMHVLLDDNSYMPISSYGDAVVSYVSNYRWSMWGDDAIYPEHVFFHGGRLGYAINTNFGTYYSLSKTDAYLDFTEDTYGKVLDTDAIVGLISGGSVSNRINWVISREKIYLGSYGTEFVIAGANDVITPTSAYCRPVSFTGGEKVQALKYMTTSLFVGANGKELYTVNYDFNSDTYIPTNVSYVSEHLLEDKIVKLAGAPRPDKTIYVLTRKGKLVQYVNYLTEQVSAFSELELGKVRDVSVVYSGNNTEIVIAREEDGYISLERIQLDNPNYMISAETFVTESGYLNAWKDEDTDDVVYTRVTTDRMAGVELYTLDGHPVVGYDVSSCIDGNEGSIRIVRKREPRDINAWRARYEGLEGLPDVIYTMVGETSESENVFLDDGTLFKEFRIVSMHADYMIVEYKSEEGEEIQLAYDRHTEEDKQNVNVQKVELFFREPDGDHTAVIYNIECPRFAGKEVYVKYKPKEESDWQFIKATADNDGTIFVEEGVAIAIVGLPMVMNISTQPIFGGKLEGLQQASIRAILRILNTGHFYYGTTNEDKMISFDPWSAKQEYEREHMLATGDIQVDVPLGYMKKSNIADSEYPDNTAVGINIKSDTPEPFNLLLISEIYK